MFKIESYVTPILLSYVDKYVRDFKPADAQVSLWGGGVALHNLVLKADVLQQEVSLPFTLVSGRIHELLIQVPWTKIMSEPIIVTIDTIECVLSLHPPASPDGSPPPESPSRKSPLVEAPPGYMQALVRRIVSNIALRVHHLIVKYVQDDVVLSLNVKHLAVDSAGTNWEAAFADIDQAEPVIRRLVRLDDLTLCLDRADSDGKIRYYQEPLLYRCQLDFRVLTRLVSANTRRASRLTVQLRSSKLAFGVTSEQLVLLLRLLRERPVVEQTQPPPPTNKTSVAATPLHVSSSNSAEPARQESWSEWAWSWLPTWMDSEGGVEEAPVAATPTPIHFTAYLDDISLVYKVMELEGGSRKRARGVLELIASYAAIKSYFCSPTSLRARVGARLLTLCSHGKCVCGHSNLCTINHEPTVYLTKLHPVEEEGSWKWPEEDFTDQKVEIAQVINEEYRESPEVIPSQSRSETKSSDADPGVQVPSAQQSSDAIDELWLKMEPVVYLEYVHDRSPPDRYANPYENPPMDFEYSDWVEVCTMRVKIDPMELRIGMDLLHRTSALMSALDELPPVPVLDLPMRTLTVEENEALSENLPQRSITLEANGFRIRSYPWDHAPNEKPTPSALVLDVELPQTTIVINGPMYPHRVCSAACQMPDDTGPLWQGARLHVSISVSAVQVNINTPEDPQPRPCARADLRFVFHMLLHKELFTRESVEFSYSFKIREANVSGSAPRVQAAFHILASLFTNRPSPQLKLTTLARDAVNDDDSVAIDVTVEEVSMRGYLTRHINTHILSVQSSRATAIHAAVADGEDMKQAWIFAAPEAPTTTPFLRLALQWCSRPIPNSLDYLGAWTEPIAFTIDPLFIAWLAYKPMTKSYRDLGTSSSMSSQKHSQFFIRRRATPPSSSGRSRSGADMIHVHPRSAESSEPSEKKDERTFKNTQETVHVQPVRPGWTQDGEYLLRLHDRLRHMLVNVELGLVLLYLTESTASAVDCASVRDAMDRYATEARTSVLVISFGRLSMHSSATTQHFWQLIRHDGPTFIPPPETKKEEEVCDLFPWRLRVADMSCYTLEVHVPVERASADKSRSGLRSQLKLTGVIPCTVVELITTTVTLSVVTKSMQFKTVSKPEKKKKQPEPSSKETRTQYFTSGIDFKPATLKEFVRGPAKRKKPTTTSEQSTQQSTPTFTVSSGPVVSLGVHLHADTPPIIVRLNNQQVHVVATAIHCLKHIVQLLQRPPMTASSHSFTSLGGSHRSLIRSVSEIGEVRTTPSDETTSGSRSELIPIYESKSMREFPPMKLKTFFWFQWVVSRATVVVATQRVKMAFEIDDIISTVDLQEHYSQLKVKLASASVRHYERTGSEEWKAGVLGGRVLEVREPNDAKEENHFLAITITQAQVSNLPASWKEELHPKLLEQKSSSDTMWEVYATLAPLEAVLQPMVVEHLISLVHLFSPRSFCPLTTVVENRPTSWQWPFCYLSAGGIRLLVTTEEENQDKDDTFMVIVGKITVNPHPDNPICRRPVSGEVGWSTGGAPFEGRQYEVLVKNMAVRSAKFSQLVYHESCEGLMKSALENPAVKWTQPDLSPIITPVLHSVDVGCVLAPALYVGGLLACGPAVELNLVSDCAIELSVAQLALLRDMITNMQQALLDARCSVTTRFKTIETCPYATVIMSQDIDEDEPSLNSETTVVGAPLPTVMKHSEPAVGQSFMGDSGVDTLTSKSSRNLDDTAHVLKKSVSIALVEQMAEASEYLEVFVTMGVIEVALYTVDDNSPEVIALRPPPNACKKQTPVTQQQKPKEEVQHTSSEKDTLSRDSRSITDTIRKADVGTTKLEINALPYARSNEHNLPLVQVTLNQPNLYYWKKKHSKTLQVSLFNAWVALGMGETENLMWNQVLLSTARGIPDPVTDIPPALATMKLIVPCSTPGTSGTAHLRGTASIDIERPVQIEVCTDRLRRIKDTLALIDQRVLESPNDSSPELATLPLLYRFRRFMGKHTMESVTIQTSQVGMCGSEGTVGWGSASLQLAGGVRPDRVVVRGLVTALLVAAGSPADRRHVLLQPLTFGLDAEATWEAWRRAEGGQSAREPTVRASVCLDRVTVDLRPADLVTLRRIQQTVDQILSEMPHMPRASRNIRGTLNKRRGSNENLSHTTVHEHRYSVSSIDGEISGHYYKDDLRSGAFKMVRGGQLPMAYQVMIHGNAVSWRYPHPRAITRIVVFPLPDLEEEVDCVLELFNPMLSQWTPHTYFKLPVSEPRELKLYVPPPDVVFGLMWRVIVCDGKTEQPEPFEFNMNKFLPRQDPLLSDVSPETEIPRCDYRVSAEQLSGVLRVDSYFAPRLLPHTRVVMRASAIEVNLHNSLPLLSSQATALEGYYVSRPLMRSHRVLSLNARDVTANAHLGSPAGTLTILDSNFSADILDCATGAIEELVENFRLRGAVSIPSDLSTRTSEPRVRCRTSRIHVTLHVPRLRTLHVLAMDWKGAIDDYVHESLSSSEKDLHSEKIGVESDLASTTAAALDGRVSLWIHNSCAAALRIGQEGTDEVVPLGPGATLAYRWRSPSAAKRLRLAFAGPTADWHWSSSIPFTGGSAKVRLEDSESKSDGKIGPSVGVFVHVHVVEEGARRSMHLSGRLALTNMLRHNLLYKVRGRSLPSNQWQTVCSGEMAAEGLGCTVICAADTEIILKIKFVNHETGWSGDIPLKECPKENVPWLVKIPSQGDVPYISVWCRVVRARSDGRIIATIWPLYVLHSHLPLDTDVMVASEATPSMTDISGIDTRPAPLIQTAPGRGASTHLLAPGTTAARHNLSFQYKNIECPVTREAVPMHYGVTDTSVFDKRAPVHNIDEVVDEIQAWLHRSGRDAISDWPYSLVTKHWPGAWQAALLQPRCDVVVRYQPVRAGGGCSLEIQLSPVVLLCNAAPIALTLRAHDAAPLCKLEPGSAISPPSAILKKPFFMSVEMGRETFVSGQLEVTNSEPGRYSAPPPGKLAIDHSADFVIQCNHKVALLTMYYEIKENINVLGISSTYTLVNRLNMDIVVSAIAVPKDGETNILLRPKAFKVIPPTKSGSVHGVPLCRFWLRNRWRGGCPTELSTYLCLAIPSGCGVAGAFPACSPVPVRLGGANVTTRRAIALADANGKSMAAVVTQQKQDGRWLIAIAPDPCPQFLVHNRTHLSLAIAQPVLYADDPSTSYINVVPEVEAVRWWCIVKPHTVTHYSSPAHCARYPPPAHPTPPTMPFLTIGTAREESEPNWSPSVAAADGEQLLQLYGGITIKLRVHTHPHSTLIELQDVDQNDISASDIRRRLVGALPSGGIVVSQETTEPTDATELSQSAGKLTRTGAYSKLLASEVESVASSTSHMSESVQPQDETILTSMSINVSGDLGVIKDEERDDNIDTQSIQMKVHEINTSKHAELAAAESSVLYQDLNTSEWVNGDAWPQLERVRCVLDSLAVEMATAADTRPLLTLHADRVALHVISDNKKVKTTLSVADVQIDNLQYENGQYDFAVVASTRSSREDGDRWPALWNMFAEGEAFATRRDDARLLVVTQHDKWVVVDSEYTELTEVEIALGPLALYIEDAYVSALAELWRRAVPSALTRDEAATLADEHVLCCPLRLRTLHVHPLDLTLTLHTAVRMYIALDQSPLRLSAFRLQDMMTSPERLTHAVTVHYLSAAILGAGWVVGGLELLGAPGALAARVGGATGGVRGVASAAAAALLRSLSAWAGSLARNLDLLAGDEEHARRAAAARRRPPPSLLAGLVTGITNFAINILGAVGGLAHHPLVGVAVGETESGTAALRRGLLGALTKPLSATADLVAYAGHGLLSQTGWDPIPQQRGLPPAQGESTGVGWKRDCVRWTFRLAELTALAGFEVLLDNAPLQLLLTHKFLVVADPESERIVEMIDFRFCTVRPYQGPVIELCVRQRRTSKVSESRAVDEDDEYQMSAAAMARVARYTGAESASRSAAVSEARVLHLLPVPGRSHALHAALAAAIHHNADTHFSML